MVLRTKESDDNQSINSSDTDKKEKSSSDTIFSFVEKSKQFRNAETNIMVTSNVYDVYSCETSSPVCLSPKYRLIFCNPPNNPDLAWCIKTDDFSNVDKSIEIAFSQVEYKSFKEYEEFSQYEDRLKVVKQGHTAVKINEWNINKILEEFKQNPSLFKNLLDWLVDDTYDKDERITSIIKASYIPIPIKDVYFQRYNNHAIVITNAKTGKTHTYSNLNGVVPSVDYSEAGLIGSNSSYGINHGSLSGEGSFGFDEITGLKNDKDSSYLLVDRLLNYMEDGISTRDLATRIECRGTKALIFFGNTTSVISENAFNRILNIFVKAMDTEKLGRRIGHVIFNDEIKTCNTKRLSRKDLEAKKIIKNILNEMIASSKDKIMDELERMTDFIEENVEHEDVEYFSILDSIADSLQTQSVKKLIKGIKMSTPRLQFASAKIVLLNNLDKFLLSKEKNDISLFKDELMYYYKKFKEWNIETFERLLEENKGFDKFISDIEEHNIDKEELFSILSKEKREEIAKKLDISVTTLYRYKIKLEKLNSINKSFTRAN